MNHLEAKNVEFWQQFNSIGEDAVRVEILANEIKMLTDTLDKFVIAAHEESR